MTQSTRPPTFPSRAALLAALAVAGAGAMAGCSTAEPAAAEPAAAEPAAAKPAGAACAAGAAGQPAADCCADGGCAVETAAAGAAPATRPATGPATHPATAPAGAAAAGGPATHPAAADAPAAAAEWRTLFDGKSLAGWKSSEFAGQGEVEVKDGAIVLPVGEGLTGVTYAADAELPKANYEIEVVARRVEGHDFFCGLTFPVNAAHAALIVGGWGGAVVGISSIDDEDAAHNATTQYAKFDTGKWYTVRVRVLPEKIQAWVDDKRMVDVDTKGKKVDIRPGTEECRPLGLASWQTTAAVRSVKLRKVEGEGK